MNTKTEKPKYFGTKTEKPFYKIAKTAKPKIPMPPSIITSDVSLVLSMAGKQKSPARI